MILFLFSYFIKIRIDDFKFTLSIASDYINLTDSEHRTTIHEFSDDKREEVEKDETCDSQFMMDTIFEIGDSIRTSFNWVP